MKTGFAVVSINPKEPSYLSGYAPYRMSTGIHDDIYVRALIWGSDEPIVMIQFDLVVIDTQLKQAIAERLEKHGYASERILVSATHTHSSLAHVMDTNREPLMKMVSGDFSIERIHEMADKAEEAIIHAAKSMKETTIRMCETMYQGLGSNRTDAALPGDQQLAIIELRQNDGTNILIYNISCHATVMDQSNTLISADFPGSIYDQLKDTYAMVMFLNGSCGDMSTRFNRKESTFAECDRLASGVVNAIKQTVENQEEKPLSAISMENFTVTLPLRKPLTLEVAKAQYDNAQKELDTKIREHASQGEIRLAKEKCTGAQFQLLEAENYNTCADQSQADDIAVPCSLMNVMGQRILFIPLELYSKLSLQIKAKEAIWIVGYTNHHLGYMPDHEAYEKHDYESALTLFAQGAGELFVKEIVTKLQA